MPYVHVVSNWWSLYAFVHSVYENGPLANANIVWNTNSLLTYDVNSLLSDWNEMKWIRMIQLTNWQSNSNESNIFMRLDKHRINVFSSNFGEMNLTWNSTHFYLNQMESNRWFSLMSNCGHVYMYWCVCVFSRSQQLISSDNIERQHSLIFIGKLDASVSVTHNSINFCDSFNIASMPHIFVLSWQICSTILLWGSKIERTHKRTHTRTNVHPTKQNDFDFIAFFISSPSLTQFFQWWWQQQHKLSFYLCNENLGGHNLKRWNG